MGIQMVGGHPVQQDYIPGLYSPILLEKFHDNTFLTRVTNRDYEGQLRNAGDRITIRQLPEVQTYRYRKGMNIPYQGYETQSQTFEVSRSRGHAFKINSIDQILSDIDGFAAKWTDEGAVALALDNEKEFLADVPAKCHVKNQGVTAGVKSESYNLGSSTVPLKIVKSGTPGENESFMVDAIANCAAALEEQPGGMGESPWIIVPVWGALRIQTGELKNAYVSGDSTSLLRKNVKAMGNIAGFDVYVSNLIHVDTLESAKLFNCLFGDRKGITFAEQVSLTEIKDNPYDHGKLHSSLMIYDWYPIQPTRFGHMVITQG
jgi:hypothetical protein